ARRVRSRPARLRARGPDPRRARAAVAHRVLQRFSVGTLPIGLTSPPVPVLDSVRQEWEEGNRRFEELARDRALRPRLFAQLEIVTDELRKRVGQTFTLAELAS